MGNERYRTRFEIIESRVSYLQRELWNRRNELWDTPPENPIRSLDPGVALWDRGYSIITVPDLGEMFEDGRRSVVAGVLDPEKRAVEIVAHLSNESRLYTAAHELGHAELHASTSLIFRDRPVAGPTQRSNEREREADWFAACFLMPRQLVTRLFHRNFGRERLGLTNETTYMLADVSLRQFKSGCRTLRDFSRQVAMADRYGESRFQPLSEAFGVSASTMAIRLEELGLVG